VFTSLRSNAGFIEITISLEENTIIPFMRKNRKKKPVTSLEKLQIVIANIAKRAMLQYRRVGVSDYEWALSRILYYIGRIDNLSMIAPGVQQQALAKAWESYTTVQSWDLPTREEHRSIETTSWRNISPNWDRIAQMQPRTKQKKFNPYWKPKKPAISDLGRFHHETIPNPEREEIWSLRLGHLLKEDPNGGWRAKLTSPTENCLFDKCIAIQKTPNDRNFGEDTRKNKEDWGQVYLAEEK